ncbi:MAG TPA: GNAT family protein [Spirochaetia bacterium]|nr:GNAT family protein [Spirochaetia bacterium]
MSAHEADHGGPQNETWPERDPEGRPVRFISREVRPRADEYTPVLVGTTIRLVPLEESHFEALCAIGLDPEITRFMPRRITDRDGMRVFIREALNARQSRTAIPFAVTLKDRRDPRVVGTTRFLGIDARNGRMEIGATWLGKQWQRTRVNTEAKYLMLRWAFDELGCTRVEFKTDSLNERSRRALLRIGAIQEGIFRSHIITADGRIRHSVYYAITTDDWPGVKARLSQLLSRPADDTA